jgi:2-keto-4-pentenoate hydratase/2-oxohepta-3-ene-1,7-dioic acid hydratase in catechol pathway
MRFVTYRLNGATELGVRTDDGIVAAGYPGLRDYLEAGDAATEKLEALLATKPPVVVPDRLLSPLAERCQLICVGGNYSEHLAEAGLHPSEPVYFPKLWSAVLAPGEPLRMPEETTLLDYEVEFSVIIGRTAKNISAEEALDYVFGYTVINDMGARDVMEREPLQILLCKSADGFLPVAEEIVTTDEVEIGANAITTTVNGELRQNSTLDDMIYKLPHLLSFLSRSVTLQPGDLVTTGTPGGVGMGMTPPGYLHPGDVVVASVAGVGSVTTTIAGPV